MTTANQMANCTNHHNENSATREAIISHSLNQREIVNVKDTRGILGKEPVIKKTESKVPQIKKVCFVFIKGMILLSKF